MEFNRKEKDLKKKEEEILMRFDQYNNINMATTDPNLTTVPKQRRYTFSVEHFSNDISVNHKVSVKASSFDDLQKKIAREMDVPNDTKFSLVYKKGNKFVSLNDVMDLLSTVTWNVRLLPLE